MGAIILSALILRVYCATDQFWMDEIWSLNFAFDSSSWINIFKIKHDNNHILNTLYLWFVGEQNHWIYYRLLSILTGTAVIALLFFVTIGKNSVEKLFCLILGAVSYPLILYASEARGYSPAAAAGLCAYILLSRYEHKRNFTNLSLFWLAIILGMLAHITVVYLLLALIIKSIMDYHLENRRPASLALHLVSIYLVPCLFLCGYYFFIINNLFIAGGPEINFFETIRHTLFLASGFPDYPGSDLLAVAALMVVFVSGLYLLMKNNPSQSIFFLNILFLAPFAVLVIKPPSFLHFRYFLICLPFFFILTAHVLYRLYVHSLYGKALTLIALVLFCSGNAGRVYNLISVGRGDYQGALSYMYEKTTGNVITIGSDHDLGSAMVLSFYSRFLSSDKKIKYYKINEWPESGPEWVLIQSQEKQYTPRKRVTDNKRRSFVLQNNFEFEGSSGWHWSVYRNEKLLNYLH